jgi:hypothetical protein
MAIKKDTSWQAKSDTPEKKWENKLFAFCFLLISPLGRYRNADLLVNLFLCLNDEKIVLPNKKSP